MKEKGILKFKTDTTKGAMHYISYDGKKVSITLKYSNKIAFIKKHSYINIASNLLSTKFKKIKASVHDDIEFVKNVFNHMNSEKHTHYKRWDENLVVIEYLN